MMDAVGGVRRFLTTDADSIKVRGTAPCCHFVLDVKPSAIDYIMEKFINNMVRAGPRGQVFFTLWVVAEDAVIIPSFRACRTQISWRVPPSAPRSNQ